MKDSQGATLLLGEVYWADLSSLGRSFIGTLWGFFRLIFGLRFLAWAAAAREESKLAKGILIIGLVIYFLLTGPVLAFNLLAAILYIAAEICKLLSDQGIVHISYLGQVEANRIVLVVALAVGAVSALVGRRSKGLITTSLSASNVLISASLCVVAVWGMGRPGSLDYSQYKGLLWYIHGLFFVLHEVWNVLLIAIVINCLLWLASWPIGAQNRSGLNAAFLLPMVSVGLYEVVVPILWLVGKAILGQVAELPEFDIYFKGAVPLFGFQLLATACSAVTLLGVLGFYLFARNRPGMRSPRIILSPVFQASVAITVIAGALGEFYYNTAPEPTRDPFLRMVTAINNPTVTILALVIPITLVSLSTLMPFLRAALRIAADVVDHFQRPAEQDRLLPIPRVNYDLREARRIRVASVIEHLTRECDPQDMPSLDLISHSQGTVLSIEALNDGSLGANLQSFRTVRLVTVGSPFQHIYQHYFRREYAVLGDASWKNLKAVLGSWVNIYRVDDYVGTHVFDGVAEADLPFPFLDHPVPAAGHLDYWLDREVIPLIWDYETTDPRMPSRNGLPGRTVSGPDESSSRSGRIEGT